MVATPTGLTATPVSPTAVDVSWDAVSGASYDVEENGVVVVTGHPSPALSRTGLTPGTGYDYRVRARIEDTASLIDPATPGGTQPAGQSSGWVLTLSDEFAGTSLNTAKWEPYYADTSYWAQTVPGGHLTNTNEPQAYDISGITFGSSVMTFTMRDEVTVTGLPYTSGMVSSYASFSQTYGWFEARIKVDNINGAWPAFWLFPLDQDWQGGPEIDIFEAWPSGSWDNVAEHALHQQGQSPIFDQNGVDTTSNWHVYAVNWHAGGFDFYIDGALTWTVTDAAYRVAEPMYIHCNLAGDMNDWPVSGDLPITMNVDYIRVWEASP